MLVVWVTTLSTAHAHEVIPSIADMRVVDGNVRFEVRANIESFVAEIDLSATADTNTTDQAAAYDALRALPPTALADRFRAFWPQMAQDITLLADGRRLAPTLVDITVGPIGNIELVRPSTITFQASLPEDAQTLQVGWAPAYGVLVLRQMDVPAPYDGYLEGGVLSDQIALAGGGQTTIWQTFVHYVPVGFDHIVPRGLDHILFILALFFLAARFKPLLVQVAVFSVAHTLALMLAALGHMQLLADWTQARFGLALIDIVTPLIALSVAYVAIENILSKELSRWRPVIIFFFGLLHGLGFAAGLARFGLPQETFMAALIGFNVGIEVAQLAVIAAIFLIVWQALRVDRGENEALRAYVLYGLLFVVGVGLMVLNGAGLAGLGAAPAQVLAEAGLLLALTLPALAALCFVSVALRSNIEAYRHIVAVPASVFIAIIGLYWFMERTFL